ncbi:MAG: PQQ-binding-like beta-propeller repeat protein [Caldisericia bacterium]|nr:PQQ-binding-like beta-propeller repeat protein [Caldisericia bacterium]
MINRRHIVTILVCFLLTSTLLVSCGIKPTENNNSNTENSENTTQDDNDNNTENEESETERIDIGLNEDGIVTIELNPSITPNFITETFTSYPCVMGIPSVNSIWDEDKIFIDCYGSGVTKIALNGDEMIQEESYMLNKTYKGASEDYFICVDKQYVYCLTKRDGKELWKRGLTQDGSDYFFIVNNDIVVHMLFNPQLRLGTVKGYNSTNGKTLWEIKLTNESQTFLGFSSEILLFTDNNSLIGRNPSDGEIKWQNDSAIGYQNDAYLENYYRNFLILKDRTLFLPASQKGNPLAYRIEPSTGKILTEYRVDQSPDYMEGAKFQANFFEIGDSILASGSFKNEHFIISFDKSNGKVNWRTPIEYTLGTFAKKYGANCEYDQVGNDSSKVLLDISMTTEVLMNVNDGSIEWYTNCVFSQTKGYISNSYQVRIQGSEQKSDEIIVDFLNLKLGKVTKRCVFPSDYKLPDFSYQVHTTDKYAVIRADTQRGAVWVFLNPENNQRIAEGCIENNNEGQSETLAFYVGEKNGKYLYLATGEKGYEINIFTLKHKN